MSLFSKDGGGYTDFDVTGSEGWSDDAWADFDQRATHDAYDWDRMGTLLGAQGSGGQRSRAQQMQAPMMQAPNAMNTLQGLMGMVGRPQQMARPGTPYQNRYVSGLMDV